MKAISIIIFLFITTFSFAQSNNTYEHVKLELATDYVKADSVALEAANFMFATPFEKNNLQRLYSLSFIIKWMTGTPDYTFTLDEVASKIMKGNDDLLGLYMAAMTKYALENKAFSKDLKMVKLNALITVLNYCEDPKNNIKMTKQLRKLSEAKAKGQLEQSI